jgi:hypothetical protein
MCQMGSIHGFVNMQFFLNFVDNMMTLFTAASAYMAKILYIMQSCTLFLTIS